MGRYGWTCGRQSRRKLLLDLYRMMRAQVGVEQLLSGCPALALELISNLIPHGLKRLQAGRPRFD